MHCVGLQSGADLVGFKCAVRGLIASKIAPEHVIWNVGNAEGLFDAATVSSAPPVRLSRELVNLASIVVCHRDPEKYALLYTTIWRVLHGEPYLLEVHSDR